MNTMYPVYLLPVLYRVVDVLLFFGEIIGSKHNHIPKKKHSQCPISVFWVVIQVLVRGQSRQEVVFIILLDVFSRIGGRISKPKTVPILRGILEIVGLKLFFKRGLSIIFTLQKFCYGLDSDSLLLWCPLIRWFATWVLCWINILLSWRGSETVRFRLTRFWLFWDNGFVSKGRRDNNILAFLGWFVFICSSIN